MLYSEIRALKSSPRTSLILSWYERLFVVFMISSGPNANSFDLYRPL